MRYFDAPDRKLARWWLVTVGGEALTVYANDDGTLQECFPEGWSKGPEYVYRVTDYHQPGDKGGFRRAHGMSG